jgi:nicotinate-nucleotide adenylyltransferase
MRLGLFGGSFDPVHRGHVELARACQQGANLDQVWFLPAAKQPFKQHGPVASDADRLAMLELAIEGEPTWRVSSLEIDRGGVSYTVDTLREIHEQLPGTELYFLMGADALHELPKWREPEVILDLATPLVVARAGEPAPKFDALLSVSTPERVDQIQAAQVTMPEIPISSTAIRGLIHDGDIVAAMLPNKVWDYIIDQGLYKR